MELPQPRGAVREVVVWGNCQAAPVAALLQAPLARAGLTVRVAQPPVYLLTHTEVAEVHAAMATTSVLVSQPIRDEYRVPGCSTDRLAALLPESSVVVTYPVVYDSGALPFQVTANGADGARVPAPLTDYHDLRIAAAAAAGESAADLLARWPVTAPPAAVARNAAASLAELRRREAECDVTVSDLVTRPGAMFTLNHPDNAVLAETTGRILDALGRPELRAEIDVPEREFLGAIRTPVETAVVPGRESWVVGDRTVDWDEVVDTHLRWYRDRPDVVADIVRRHGARLTDPAPTTGLRGAAAG